MNKNQLDLSTMFIGPKALTNFRFGGAIARMHFGSTT
jgi:hypothetical protein